MAASEKQTLVAVTGAGGFIGSHLTRMLLREGHAVRALVHYNALGSIGHLEEVLQDKSVDSQRLKIASGDILDERCMREFVGGCSQVFHLAALIGIPYSYAAPHGYARTNMIGTLHVLEACRDAGIERAIITSTSEVYGSPMSTPISETHPLQAQSPYSASKIAADKFAESYHRSFNLPIVTIRPFNTYGPRQSARAIVPTILCQALDDRSSQIELGSLETVRDLNYVEDTAAAFLALARAPLERVAGKVYNAGSGRGTSVAEIAGMALQIAKKVKPVVSTKERMRPEASEVDRLIADASALHRDTGWMPHVKLEEGLARTAEWIRRNPHLFRPREYQL